MFQAQLRKQTGGDVATAGHSQQIQGEVSEGHREILSKLVFW
jgi:hypothetical protein